MAHLGLAVSQGGGQAGAGGGNAIIGAVHPRATFRVPVHYRIMKQIVPLILALIPLVAVVSACVVAP
jgi:hypothetical protein